MRLRSLFLIGAVVASTTTFAFADVRPGSVDISILAGGRAFERNESAERSAFQLNVRYGYNFSERWGVEAGVDTTFTRHRRSRATLIIMDPSFDVLLYLSKGPLVPYFSAGPGVTVYKDHKLGTDGRMAFNFGAGFKWDVFEALAIRLDVRAVTNVGPLPGTLVTNNINLYATLGLNFRLGGESTAAASPEPTPVEPVPAEAPVAAPPPPAPPAQEAPPPPTDSAPPAAPSADADGDGIADPDDVCPNEAGTAANKGCASAPAL